MMKKTILILFVLLFVLSINAQEPILKISLGNGNYKTYNLSDIENISIGNYNNNALLWIYYQKSKTISQDISEIDSIKLEKNQTNFTNLVLYIKGSITKNCVLSDIDSIKIHDKLLSLVDTVKIGSQVWMLKNLDLDHYRNGDIIPEITDLTQWSKLKTGAWCYYNNSDSLGKIYGKLYNWYAVNDPRGLAPDGYHIPDDTEWTVLTNYLGGEEIAGSKLKEAGTTHWYEPNEGATNSSGFTALPGGSFYFPGVHSTLSHGGYWWTATESGASAFIRAIHYCYTYIYRGSTKKELGFSVRCVKD